jgi:flagellar FliL protein
MAEKPRAPETEQPAPPAAKKRSKLLLILLPAVLVLGAGGFVGWTQLQGKKASEPAENKASAPVPPPTVSVRPFVVNLADTGEMARYLKLEFELELRPGNQSKEVEARMAEIRDAVIVLLGSKRSQELVTVEGKDRLKDEIITRINGRLQTATANRIFFKEFIIQ